MSKSKWANKLSTLEDKAILIGHFTENNLVDPDGLVYSSISEKTKKPWTNDQIPDKVIYNCVDTPKKHWKAHFFGYEDSNMATAEFL